MDVSGLEHGSSDKVSLAWKGRSLNGDLNQWPARVLARQPGSVRCLLRRHGGIGQTCAWRTIVVFRSNSLQSIA